MNLTLEEYKDIINWMTEREEPSHYELHSQDCNDPKNCEC